MSVSLELRGGRDPVVSVPGFRLKLNLRLSNFRQSALKCSVCICRASFYDAPKLVLHETFELRQITSEHASMTRLAITESCMLKNQTMSLRIATCSNAALVSWISSRSILQWSQASSPRNVGTSTNHKLACIHDEAITEFCMIKNQTMRLRIATCSKLP